MSRTFSVVITTFRRTETVLECIASVLGQTHPPLEVIVVDDGSEDGTSATVRRMFPSVTVIEQPNLGRSVARNAGAAAAQGDFVCFLDDDDLWHPEKLAATADYLRAHPECLALNHPVWFFADPSHPRPRAYGFEVDFRAASLEECLAAVQAGDPSRNDWGYLDINGQSHRLLLERNRGALSASVVERRTFHTAGGFATSLASAEDWLLFLAVARITEWHTIPRRLAFCRQHGAQSTDDIDNTVSILAAYVFAWFGGRALPGAAAPSERDAVLDTFRLAYRDVAQHFVWAAVKAGRWELVPQILALSRPLLRRRRDRLVVRLPPRVTARAARR